MKTAHGTKDGTGSYIKLGPAASDDAHDDYRNSDGYVLSGPGVPDRVQRPDRRGDGDRQLRRPRGTVSSLGRQLRQPRRPVPRRPPRTSTAPAAQLHHGARLLHPDASSAWDWRDGAADAALEVRLQHDAEATPPATVQRPGRPQHVRRRRRRRPARRSCTARWPSTTTGAGSARPATTTATPARRRSRSRRAPAWRCSCATRTAPTPRIASATRAPARSSRRGRSTARQRPRRRRRHLGGSPGAELWASSADGLSRRPRNANLGPKPSSQNFLVWWDGDETRELRDGTSDRQVRRQHRLLTAQRRARRTTAPSPRRADRRPPRRLARGGHLARERQLARCASTPPPP